MKVLQVVEIFPLNPRSNGDGRSLVLVDTATGMLVVALLDAVDEGLLAEDVDVFIVVADVLADELELISRRLRSSVASWTQFAAGIGGGRGSTRIVPERARRANVDSSVSTCRVSTICSSMKKLEAVESETQHEKNIKSIMKWELYDDDVCCLCSQERGSFLFDGMEWCDDVCFRCRSVRDMSWSSMITAYIDIDI